MAELIDKNKFETYTKIANEFGTPAYVFDKDEFEYRINHIKKAATAFDEFRVNTKIYYASKSLLTVQIAKMILENDLYIDCCSEGEILIAEKGAEGLSDYGKRFSLHGNNKTVSEIEYAINNNFSHLVIDSDDEIDFVNDIAKRLDKK
ncbi:MAG: hypothetical protein LBN03_02335, partial [Bifidobacteriaceae bacterium]|nr:hypothetical protein [Bifidobacteriaceae bacterium]